MKSFFYGTLVAFVFSGPAFAFTYTSTVGNGASGLVDGTIYNDLIADIQPVQAGQAAPFDQGYGNELFGPSFNQGWTHDFGFGPIVEEILSGTIEFGIYQHDSASAGSQIAAFQLDSFDLTSELDILLEASGGAVNEYNVYTLALPELSLTELIDGLAAFSLELQGPGAEQCSIFDPFDCSFAAANGAHLIFAELTIVAVPVPAALWLFGSALALLGWSRRKSA